MAWTVRKGKISNFAAFYHDVFIMSLSYHNSMRFSHIHIIIYIFAIALALPHDAAARKKETDGKSLSVFVHPGTGLWTGFSARLGSENEIVLITLNKKGK